MSSQPVRSYLFIAAAIVIAGVLISASVFVSVGEPTKTTTTTSTLLSTTTVTATSTELCGQQVWNSTSVSVTNCQLGVTLLLGIRETTVPTGTNETFYVSMRNDLPVNNTLSRLGSVSLPHINESSPGAIDDVLPAVFCRPSVPAWIIIYNQSGLPVQLSAAQPIITLCSETANNGPTFEFAPSQTLTQTLSVGGYLHSPDAAAPWENATFSQFSPGQYTVLAYDQWSPTVSLNFTVNFGDH